MEEIDLEGLDDKELKKVAFIVDFLPKNFPISGMYQMNGMMFLHIRDRYCMCVKFLNEAVEEFKA